MPTRPASVLFMLALLALLASGCQTPIPRVRFEPKLQQVLVQSDPAVREDVARLVVSVLRVQRVDRHRFELLVRLRVENFVDRPIGVRTRDMTLVSADLRAFGRPRVRPSADPMVAGHSSGTFDLVFPFPPEQAVPDMDLSALNLRWTILDGELEIPVDMGFVGERVPTYVYYPSPYHCYDPVWVYR